MHREFEYREEANCNAKPRHPEKQTFVGQNYYSTILTLHTEHLPDCWKEGHQESSQSVIVDNSSTVNYPTKTPWPATLNS